MRLLFGGVIDRLVAGFLIGLLLSAGFGAHGSPAGYLGAVFLSCAVTAIVLDRYGSSISGRMLSSDESTEERPEPT